MNDLLVYLALSRFRRRPHLHELPRDIQLDIRAFFRNYGRATAEADRLLFSAGDVDLLEFAFHHTEVGKLTGNSLYVHKSALDSLAPILRTFEGCGRALVGEVEEANVVKLHRGRPVISYLSYPHFDSDAHPALAASLVVNLRSKDPEYREYADLENPPVLHRKEDLVGPEYPMRERFRRLTRQEEKQGLYQDTSRIGTQEGWMSLLAAKGLVIKGHRLYRSGPKALDRGT
jgi:DNA phosphorothioation-associated putative methyltransferase